MAAEKSGGSGSILGNSSVLLALFTIAGGVWLVSQKLTSNRPVTPAGNDNLARVTKIQARRFEIGNRMAVDLSISDTRHDTIKAQGAAAFQLQPKTRSEMYPQSQHNFSRLWWSLAAVALLLGGASCVWDRLRRLTWEGLEYPCTALDYTEEDIGGPDGAEALLRHLSDSRDVEFSNWLWNHDRIVEFRVKLGNRRPDKSVSGTRERGESFAELMGGEELKKKTDGPLGDINWERVPTLSDLTSVELKTKPVERPANLA